MVVLHGSAKYSSDNISIIKACYTVGLDNLDHLIMNHNQLSHVGEGYFNGLPKLTTLYLDHNKIKSIHKDSFVGLEGNT